MRKQPLVLGFTILVGDEYFRSNWREEWGSRETSSCSLNYMAYPQQEMIFMDLNSHNQVPVLFLQRGARGHFNWVFITLLKDIKGNHIHLCQDLNAQIAKV